MKKNYKSLFEKWNPPSNWLKIKTIDYHTEGEPLRIIYGGLPEIKGKTILEKRRYFKENFDNLRTALMFEPRGHADMYGCIITDPVTESADFGVLFLHNEGYSTMCGHGIIAVTKASIDTGMIEITYPVTEIKIDTPAGLVLSRPVIKNNAVESVRFNNVPSFVFAANRNLDVPGIGKINYDIAFGGAFYAFVNAEDAGVVLTAGNFRNLIEKGMVIKKAVMNDCIIRHPFENELNFLYGTIFTGPPHNKNSHSRNVCIFAEGEVDRSPTGTGVSARMALHYSKGEIDKNKVITIESILGTSFTGKVVDTVRFGPYDAVIPEVGGKAFITGKHEFIIDPSDLLKEGFILR